MIEVAVETLPDRDVVRLSGPCGVLEVTRFALYAGEATILDALNRARGRLP